MSFPVSLDPRPDREIRARFAVNWMRTYLDLMLSADTKIEYPILGKFSLFTDPERQEMFFGVHAIFDLSPTAS